MKISFFAVMDEIPRSTHQEKGVRIVRGRPMFYEKKEVAEIRRFYSAIFKAYQPPQPMTGAVAVRIGFHYPVKRPHKDGEVKGTRPDLDNMAKLILDVATACGFWNDDGQIALLQLSKSYSSPSGIGFEAYEMDKRGNRRIEDDEL